MTARVKRLVGDMRKLLDWQKGSGRTVDRIAVKPKDLTVLQDYIQSRRGKPLEPGLSERGGAITFQGIPLYQHRMNDQ